MPGAREGSLDSLPSELPSPANQSVNNFDGGGITAFEPGACALKLAANSDASRVGGTSSGSAWGSASIAPDGVRSSALCFGQSLGPSLDVLKSGYSTKTTICTVSRARLRRRNHTKRNLPLAFQFVCGSPSPRAANKLEGK